MYLEYTVTDAKAKFSEVINHITLGHDVIVTKNGVPIAKITEYTHPNAGQRVGFAKGKIHLSNDFDSYDAETAAALGIAE